MLRTTVRRILRSSPRRRAGVSAAIRPCRCEPLERRLCLAVTFAAPTTFSLSGGTFSGSDLGLGDVNRDGKIDAVLGYSGTPSSSSDTNVGPAVFLNAGGGILGAGTRTTGLPQNMIAVGDFNGDMLLDLAFPVVGGFGQPGIAVLRGDGSGDFGSPTGQLVSATFQDVLSGDFNGDQRADLIVADANSRLLFLPGDASSGLGAPSNIPFPATSAPKLLASADFNGDMKQDLLVASAGTEDVTVLIGSGTGGFGSKPPVSFGLTGQTTISAIATGDFNGDQKADAIVGLTDGTARVLLGAGDGTLQATGGPLNVGAPVRSLAVGDFDGDNRGDVASANPTNGGVRILRGLGNGTFESPNTISGAASGGATLAAADFNADGKLDLALAQNSPAGVSIFLNTSPPADVTPPTARLEAPNLTAAGRYFIGVDVVYSDNVAVNPSTVGFGDVTITGPGGYNETSHIYSTIVSGSEVRARYYLNYPASGYWNAAANGTYTVTLNPNRVKDASGNATPGGTLGTFQVNIPFDNTPPQTVLASAPNVTIPGGTEYRLSVIHSDNIALPVVIGEGAVVVKSPNGTTLSQSYVYRIYPPAGSSVVPYDYAVTPPGGSWDIADSGTYTIELLGNALFDTSGNAAAPKSLGTFQVNIQSGTGSITASVFDDANADGIQNPGEGPLNFQQVYVDVNGNGVRDGGDPVKFTNSSGIATFSNLPAGDYVLRAVPSTGSIAGQFQTFPATAQGGEHRITLAAGASVSRAFGISSLPGVLGIEFVYQSAPHALKIFFSRNVSASVGMEDLSIINLTTGQVVFPAAFRYDPVAENKNLYETATFTFAGVLADGNYRVTLNKTGITDSQGRTLAGNNVFDFFVLAADANHDRKVDFNDLVVLAQNYNATGKTFSTGDFDYDGDVDFADLVLLAQRYNTTLPPPSPATAAAVWNSIVPIRRPRPKPARAARIAPLG
jgi:FG-GAP-like repeat